MFQKLISFLRAQYPDFGFQEVLTPTIYKQELWEQSGHWQNYKADMFRVVGENMPEPDFVDRRLRESLLGPKTLEEYGMKPMNCPAHCILFQSQRRSYRDLPIRYAEFSPLHRNELSGALSGLTRVRRFHQDDGHIFCRPSQVMEEISRSIQFIKMVYETLHIKAYHFELSTRPSRDYIGSEEEWDRAEAQLIEALDADPNIKWTQNKGDGAFYGPKIDVVMADSSGKRHQTATIQLDFQLPKRFGLEYDAPATQLKAKGHSDHEFEMRKATGKETPVMIHRAVLGSLERFLALMLEENNGGVPFWMSPRQIAILTVTDRDHVKSHAKQLKDYLSDIPQTAPLTHGPRQPKRTKTNTNINDPDHSLVQAIAESTPEPKQLNQRRYTADIDDSDDSLAQKIARTHENKYNIAFIVGEKNIPQNGDVKQSTIDVSFVAQPNLEKTWDIVEIIQPGSQAPRQKDKGAGNVKRRLNGVRLETSKCKAMIRRLTENYL